METVMAREVAEMAITSKHSSFTTIWTTCVIPHTLQIAWEKLTNTSNISPLVKLLLRNIATGKEHHIYITVKNWMRKRDFIIMEAGIMIRLLAVGSPSILNGCTRMK